MQKSTGYTSFLVRLWREPPALVEPSVAECEWLVQVEHIPSGEKAYFTSLEEFFAFIRARAPGSAVSNGPGER